MTSYKIRITRQAREHLREIRRYIEVELLAPDAAKNTIAAIRSQIKSLAYLPGRIPLTPDQPWHDQEIHRDRIKNYYIYFWINEEDCTVQIIAVIYVRRDQSRQLKLINTSG